MPSSKFSSPKRFYKRPAICKKAPPPLDPTWNRFYPPSLGVNFRVADLDPPIAYNFFGEFQITRIQTSFDYAGRSAGTTHYVTCRAFPIGWLGEWSFTFTIYAPFLPGDVFVYTPTIPPELHKFDSRNIGEQNVPNIDFRYFRIYG